MKDNVCRIIKINKEALFEFIYENFINQEESLLDLETNVGISNHFDVNLYFWHIMVKMQRRILSHFLRI